MDIYKASEYQICLWFKSFNSEGQLFRINNGDGEETDKYFGVSLFKNEIIFENGDGPIESASSSDINLNDFRWHQICLSCNNKSCDGYLDNKELDLNVDTGMVQC